MLVARDAVAADQLVYVYPFSLGPQVEVACGDEEVVVMCPAWAVSGLLGPGRHQWQSPEPTKPLAVYFVLTGPVEVPFDMVTQFVIPATGAQVTLRASGSVLVRVADPGLLIAQFVGLPFDRVNDGLLASVAGSVERMLVKVLPRKVAAAGTVKVVTDAAVTAALADELSSYNPTCGAVFGVEFVRFADLSVQHVGANLEPQEVSGWIGGSASDDLAATLDDAAPPTAAGTVPPTNGAGPPTSVSGEISSTASGTISPGRASGTIPPPSGAEPAAAGPPTSVSGEIGAVTPPPAEAAAPTDGATSSPDRPLFAVGTRVLVSLADGLLHAGTVLSAMQGYYELEIGGADLPLWVPGNQITPQL
ncbi:MAG: hypothetical protein R3B06_11535 [Kofleriaceae bacterium]